MISKELLSEVLRDEVKIVKFVTDNKVFFDYEDSPKNPYINVHELAHKGKEWCISQGYQIVEHLDRVEVYYNLDLVHTQQGNGNGWFDPSNTFKACEWILSNG